MPNTQSLRLVIVDDDERVRQTLVDLLDGYESLEVVGSAANGVDAIQLCERLQPDVVLMDVVMPKMDGITATEVIRRRFPDIQVVILAATYSDERQRAAYAAGANAYLHKSVSLSQIHETLVAASADQE